MFRHIKKCVIVCSTLVWRSACDLITHSGIEYAGYMAFLGILSIFPCFIFTTGILRMIMAFFDIEDQMGDAVTSVLRYIPSEITEGMGPRIGEILLGPPTSLVTLAIFNILWTSSSIIEGMRTVLNIAFRSDVTHHYVWRRFLSVVQFVLVSTAITILSLLATAISLAANLISNVVHVQLTMKSVHIGFIVVATLLALAYRTLPTKKCGMSSILIGTLLVMCCWALGSWVFRLFLQKFSQLNIIYGSMGSIIISLMFFYLLAICFIFGAEFIHHIEQLRSSPIDKQGAARELK